MQRLLKEQSSWSQMQAVERASERVSSWPAWKRTAIQFRDQDAPTQEAVCKPIQEQPK